MPLFVFSMVKSNLNAWDLVSFGYVKGWLWVFNYKMYCTLNERCIIIQYAEMAICMWICQQRYANFEVEIKL